MPEIVQMKLSVFRAISYQFDPEEYILVCADVDDHGRPVRISHSHLPFRAAEKQIVSVVSTFGSENPPIVKGE